MKNKKSNSNSIIKKKINTMKNGNKYYQEVEQKQNIKKENEENK